MGNVGDRRLIGAILTPDAMPVAVAVMVMWAMPSIVAIFPA